MDADIREALKEVGDWIKAVGNQISSTKSSLESITAMKDCLEDGSHILDTYVRIQVSRYS